MKKIFLLLILGLSMNANAGGFLFPNVEFEYAKLYLFNLDLDEPSHMDFRIYKDGIYAKSKLGNGTLLSDKFHEKVQKTFARGIDELKMGLSKCFMPRHGIIYYSKAHEPVASLSICFECDKISVWSKTGYDFNDDHTDFNYDKAEKQLKNLAKSIAAENIPVYTHASDADKYLLYLIKDRDFNATRRVTIKVDYELNGLSDTITYIDFANWVNKDVKIRSTEKVDTLENTDGTLDIYRVVKYGYQSIISFIDGQLMEGNIHHQAFILPVGISVGMSVEEVYQNFGYTKPAEGYPSEIRMIGVHWVFQLNFKSQTLKHIVMKAR